MIENGGVGMGTRSHLAQGSYLVRDSQNAKEIPMLQLSTSSPKASMRSRG
jgi:hypothetical protein